MPSETPVLGITVGQACLIESLVGLGNRVVHTAPAHSGSGTDYYFYAHLTGSWLPLCQGDPTFDVYQGQILGWSGNTGNTTGPHLHITVQKPGNISATGTSVPFPELSGIAFDGFSINTDCCPVDFFFSDSVMPGDDNAIPAPSWNSGIFGAWYEQGGLGVVGSPMDNGGGPGVHGWGPGLVQDFAGGPWQAQGIVMQKNGSVAAWWVHGGILGKYFEIGAWGANNGSFGYPVSHEYAWNSWRGSDFEGGWICWLWWWGSVVKYGDPAGEPCTFF
jgi:hypothetical protein